MAVQQFPLATPLVNNVTATATSNTKFTLLIADSVSFMLSSAAGTGTSPTLDVAIQTSPDGGTTWFTLERFTQVTTSASNETIACKTYLGIGDAATATVSAATGGQLKTNAVFAKDCRVLYTIGGTTPSFTFTVWAVYAGGQNHMGGI